MASTLPDGPESFADTGWFVEKLREGGHLAENETVKIVSWEQFGDGLATRMVRFKLEGASSMPDSVIAKFPVTGDTRALLDGIGAYKREVVFYRTLAASAPVRVPKCYVAEQDEETQDFVLVLEDLGHLSRPDQIAGLSEAEMSEVVDRLARLHAWSWQDHARLAEFADSFWQMDSPQGRAVQGQYAQLFAHVWGARREQISELVDADTLRVGDAFAECMDFFIENLARPHTIVHGELRAENLFFDAQEPVFFDFQVTSQESGIRELAYLITTSLSVEKAAEIEERLLTKYWETVRDSGIDDFSLEQAKQQYRIAAAYNLLWPVIASVRWEEATDRGRALLETMYQRAAAAIARQDALALIPTIRDQAPA